MDRMWETYEWGAGYDELFEAPGVPRPKARTLIEALARMSAADVEERKRRAELAMLNLGITFTVYSESSGVERIFPFDLVPRIIDGNEWNRVEQGLKQRVLALNHFIQDVYNERKIIDAGVVPADVVYNSPNYQQAVVGFTPPKKAWAHISGIDLVRDADGTLYVLEDNARTPSGVSYVLQNRILSTRTFPSLMSEVEVARVSDYARVLHDAVRGLNPAGPAVVLTPGIYNSAYFEHTYLAKQMGVQLVEGRDLAVKNGQVLMKTTRGMIPVGSVYRRIDDEFLDPVAFREDSMLGVPGIFETYRAGGVALVNAIGTGVADDKSVYPYVPAMIKFYLGEEAIIPNVPTYRTAEEKAREYVLTHLRELVVKPTNASGGYGVVIGPQSDDETLAATAAQIRENPDGFVAQPLIRLSTCPTLIDGKLVPRRVDLRPFIIYSGDEPWVLPGGLTRVALREGSFIVNSSQGGGSKDTWVVNGTS
ncbi:MAG: circularly permuted type 2 ATP-grasp protein [Dehalococcoidia bacterium]